MISISGKREKKKAYLKDKIQWAAREIFMTQGYESTTIGQIAERACVGLGTAYNYFTSKEDIFLMSMAEELSDTEGSLQLMHPGSEDPEEILSFMVMSNVKRLNFFGKDVWRETLAALFSGMKSESPAARELIQANGRFVEKIRSRMEGMKTRGHLPAGFASDTAVNLICGAIMTNLLSYVYDEKTNFSEACEKIDAAIRFILRRDFVIWDVSKK